MARNASSKSAALTTARERRRALDRDRDERDARIEQATADALVVLDKRVEAERAVLAATSELEEVLRRLLAEDVTVERAAALLEMDVAEVRRLTKLAAGRAVTGERAAVAVSALPDAETSAGAARRAG